MSRTLRLFLLPFLLALGACTTPPPEPTEIPPTVTPEPEPVNPLAGAWHLTSWHLENASGEVFEPFGPNPIGLIVYDELGNMSAHVGMANRPPFASDNIGEAAASEAAQGFQTYIAYFGTYEVDEAEGVVRHSVMGSTFPNWQGTVQVRYYELEGDKLTLVSEPMAGDVVQTLVWER